MVSIFRKRWLLAAILLLLAGGFYVLYLWFMPQRDVQSEKAYARLSVRELVTEFSRNPQQANARYLSSDGNSKILLLSGRVQSITKNQQQEKLVVLAEPGAPAAVNCSFTAAASRHLDGIKAGDSITVKGAITAGNQYDADLDLVENAVMVQCDLDR